MRRLALSLAHRCDYVDREILLSRLVRRIGLLTIRVSQLYDVSDSTDFKRQLCSLCIVWSISLPGLSHVRTLEFAAYEGHGASIARISSRN
jgi:hypothetical protein